MVIDIGKRGAQVLSKKGIVAVVVVVKVVAVKVGVGYQATV